MKTLASTVRPAIVALVAFTLLCGLVYPLVVGLIAAGVFPHQARGSLVVAGGRVVGSELIGQPFDEPGYLWGRPTALPCCGARSSGGSNLGPSNAALRTAVAARVAALRAADPGNVGPVPVDLVTASGSGLDPDVSPAAAYYQVPRVARARRVDEATVRAIVTAAIAPRALGILGERRVNVLRVNRALDARLGPLQH